MRFSFSAKIPISEWSSSNFQTADRAVEEYAYNTSTTDATDSSSFGYGLGGGQFGSFTAQRLKRCRFQQPIQPTDQIFLEISQDAGKTWKPPGIDGAVQTNQSVGGTTYGAGWQGVSGSTTDIDVIFNTYRFNNATSFGGAGQAWSAIASDPNILWRLRKVSGGSSVGYPVSSQNIIGRTDGVAPSSGYIGEVLSAGPTTTGLTANGTFTDIVSLTLTPGRWLLTSGGYCASGGGTFYTYIYRWKLKGTADTTDGKSQVYSIGGAAGDRNSSVAHPYVLDITAADSNKTAVLQVAMTETGSPSRSWVQHLQAIRIA